MSDQNTRMRERERRVSSRSRTALRDRSAAVQAVEENSENARRAIQDEELLSASELERSKSQLAISQDDRHREEWNAARLARYKSRTEIRNARAAIVTVNLAVLSAWALAHLIAGEASVISPVDVWHYLTSIV
jgi:hypothetical protein